MTNYAHGHEAEKYAAAYLKKQGYKIWALNWRRPRAEIDIVAQKKHGPIVFVEVKYRETSNQGNGMDYITAGKMRQMAFAADIYVTEHNYKGEYCLGVLELSGKAYDVTAWIEDV